LRAVEYLNSVYYSCALQSLALPTAQGSVAKVVADLKSWPEGAELDIVGEKGSGLTGRPGSVFSRPGST